MGALCSKNLPNTTPWKAYFESVDLFSNGEPRREELTKPEIALICRKELLFENWVCSHHPYSDWDWMSDVMILGQLNCQKVSISDLCAYIVFHLQKISKSFKIAIFILLFTLIKTKRLIACFFISDLTESVTFWCWSWI